jgi:hypothetical protein
MATPAALFGAGYSLASSVAGFNTNTAGSNKLLTELTDAEANASTGSAEKILFALLEMIRAKIESPATAGTTLTGIRMVTQDIAAIPGKVRRNYNFYVDVALGTQEVDV